MNLTTTSAYKTPYVVFFNFSRPLRAGLAGIRMSGPSHDPRKKILAEHATLIALGFRWHDLTGRFGPLLTRNCFRERLTQTRLYTSQMRHVWKHTRMGYNVNTTWKHFVYTSPRCILPSTKPFPIQAGQACYFFPERAHIKSQGKTRTTTTRIMQFSQNREGDCFGYYFLTETEKHCFVDHFTRRQRESAQTGQCLDVHRIWKS